jgi:hypothetical protein
VTPNRYDPTIEDSYRKQLVVTGIPEYNKNTSQKSAKSKEKDSKGILGIMKSLIGGSDSKTKVDSPKSAAKKTKVKVARADTNVFALG